MNINRFVSVVVVAAGQGSRMNMEKKKQYININGETVLSRTIRAFQQSNLIDEIIVVVNRDEIFYCKNEIIEINDFGKVRSIVAGGKDRQESVYRGIKEISDFNGIVLIHDGARPFIDEQTIRNCIEGASAYSAVCAAVPVKDTIKVADNNGNIGTTLDRSTLWAVQTPQAFTCSLIIDAHEKAIAEDFRGTDDAVLVERMGTKVKLVMGSYNNIKITTQEDLIFAEALANNLD